MMTAFAPILQAFFTDYLRSQLRASEHTVAAYRDTFRLLLTFTTDRTGKRASALDVADLDAPLLIEFLAHLEADRGNSVTTRNARLGAIHSLFGYAATRMPEHAGLIAQILAIPPKRANRPTVSYLNAVEIRALLAAPDRSTRIGRRDHALLQVATQTGLRVSELTGLRCQDAWLGTGPYVRCDGKGRIYVDFDICGPMSRPELCCPGAVQCPWWGWELGDVAACRLGAVGDHRDERDIVRPAGRSFLLCRCKRRGSCPIRGPVASG